MIPPSTLTNSTFAELEAWNMSKSVKLSCGGASDGEDIFKRGIENARRHGITVISDKPNKAQGDCLFESVIDNINHQDWFPDKLKHSIQYYRKKWVSEIKRNYENTDHFPGEKNRIKWNTAWSKQAESREYNVNKYNISDIVPAGLGHCVKKNILVFNVDENAYLPIQMFESTHFDNDNQPTTDIPIVLVYNGGHYESLLPHGEDDTKNCISLITALQNQTYEKPKEYCKSTNKKTRKRKFPDYSSEKEGNPKKKSRNEMNNSDRNTIFNKKEICKGCGRLFAQILAHLSNNKGENCTKHYDIESMKKEKLQTKCEIYYQKNREEKVKKRKTHYQEKRVEEIEKRKTRYQDNRGEEIEKMKEHYQENRK